MGRSKVVAISGSRIFGVGMVNERQKLSRKYLTQMSRPSYLLGAFSMLEIIGSYFFTYPAGHVGFTPYAIRVPCPGFAHRI
jgi:hypothetical protein